MLQGDIEVQVLSHPAKQCVTAQCLGEAGIPFRLYENAEWELPPDHPERAEDRSLRPAVKGYALRQFRAFRGHQEIAKQATLPYTLVFEDDAWANVATTTWVTLVNHCVRFLQEPYGYDVVSLHGRELSRPFQHQVQLLGRNFVELSPVPVTGGHLYYLAPIMRWYPEYNTPLMLKQHHGCLAYLIGETGRQKWVAGGHGGGLPCDLFMVNRLRSLVVEQSPFDHTDRRAGSLIANTGNCRRELTPDGVSVTQEEQ